jgi:hypothetical protein
VSTLVLVLPLPGGDSLDEVLVEQALRDVGRSRAERGVERARLVGESVLWRFFADDVGAYRLRARRHVSFKAFRAHPDLPVPRAFVGRAVKLVAQLRTLPPPLARALSGSHHRLLLGVQDPARKLGLAEESARHGWTARELGERIREDGARVGGEAGRPPTARKAFGRALEDLLAIQVRALAVRQEATTAPHPSPGVLADLLHDLAVTARLVEDIRAALAGPLASRGRPRVRSEGRGRWGARARGC